jgi:hypothetical protein
LDAADRATATVTGVLFLLVFACGQYVGIANYNWITPNSHELTHGVAHEVAVLSPRSFGPEARARDAADPGRTRTTPPKAPYVEVPVSAP